MERTPSTCPVCEEYAEMSASPFGDGMDYRCRRCGEFRISNAQDMAIRDKPVSERATILDKAKAKAVEGGPPYIDSYL